MCMTCYNDVDKELGKDKSRKCDACNGTGIYVWGAIINGKPQHQNKCFACAGKGNQTRNDLVRQFTYYAHRMPL